MIYLSHTVFIWEKILSIVGTVLNKKRTGKKIVNSKMRRILTAGPFIYYLGNVL